MYKADCALWPRRAIGAGAPIDLAARGNAPRADGRSWLTLRPDAAPARCRGFVLVHWRGRVGIVAGYAFKSPGDPLATTLTAFAKQNRLMVFSVEPAPVVASISRLFGLIKA
jgi:hypothetical protein